MVGLFDAVVHGAVWAVAATSWKILIIMLDVLLAYLGVLKVQDWRLTR